MNTYTTLLNKLESLLYQSTISSDEIVDFRDEWDAETDNLKEELQELEDSLEEYKEEIISNENYSLDDYIKETGLTSEQAGKIYELEQEIKEKEEELDLCLELEETIDEFKNYSADNFISEDYIDEYIEEQIKECFTIDVPDFVVIDWSETVDNVKQDYSYLEFNFNGIRYNFYFN